MDIKTLAKQVFEIYKLYENNLGLIYGGVIAIFILHTLVRRVTVSSKKKKLQAEYAKILKKKREDLEKTFQYEFDVSTLASPELQKIILQADISGLSKLLRQKKISVENLLKFFYMRSKTRGRDLKAAVETNFEQALVLAKKCDQRIAEEGDKVFDELPLFGIPFSTKESISLKGFDCTIGYVTRINQPQPFTCPLVSFLTSKGAIPLVRGNIPLSLMCYESVNEIYGRALNPHNKERTPGGSSGGEAALVGSCSIPFAVGSDIGGSVRLPAAFCGVFGMIPTPGRVSNFGNVPVQPYKTDCAHQIYIKPTMGPIAKSVSDLKLLMQYFGDRAMGNGIDCQIPPIDWDSKTCNSAPNKDSEVVVDGVKVRDKVKIGWFRCIDGLAGYNSAGEKALLKVVEALKKQGYEIEEVDLADEFLKVIVSLYQINSAEGTFDKLFEEDKHGLEVVEPLQAAKKFMTMNPILLSALKAMQNLFAKGRKGKMMKGLSAKTGYEDLVPVSTHHQDYAKEFVKGLKSRGITNLLFPCTPVPAIKHNSSGQLFSLFCVLPAFNYLFMPCGVLPVLKIEEENIEFFESEKDFNSPIAEEQCKGVKGLPIAVGLAGLPYQDEALLSLMGEIEGLLDLKSIVKP